MQNIRKKKSAGIETAVLSLHNQLTNKLLLNEFFEAKIDTLFI